MAKYVPAINMMFHGGTGTTPQWSDYAEILWIVRWLAAEPDKALAAVGDARVVPDDLANSLSDWLELTAGSDAVTEVVRDALLVIDREFDEMSGRLDLWTPQALACRAEWQRQRERAREILIQMGEERSDDGLKGKV